MMTRQPNHKLIEVKDIFVRSARDFGMMKKYAEEYMPHNAFRDLILETTEDSTFYKDVIDKIRFDRKPVQDCFEGNPTPNNKKIAREYIKGMR